ncbi:SDR family oxidoreductase [Geovibrio thiophilus]|uniref:SDR family oxidoreductase n=1 Tax=Geovibrio thiophilus TaxID=139438 RepID=A0A3R5XWQ0_9BACT|nr:SDR family oxidoreductase [Geovibrio thiophilus]QAR32490.1 SDR family oxidoreductase [Geovibrio thiophilus]
MTKCVLITGGAGGIGLGCALYFADKGWSVFIADINGEAGRDAAQKIGGADFALTDVASEESVKACVEKCVLRFGRIDALINNAGIADPFTEPLEKLSLERWSRIISVNLTGAFLMTKHCAAHLRRANGGIINMASTRAFQSEKNSESYAASKGGLLSFTHASAVSLGPDVRVNCICPGWINVSGYQTSERDHSQHPAGRVGKAEDIASLAYYLVSDEAKFITGQSFTADGGMTVKMVYVD